MTDERNLGEALQAGIRAPRRGGIYALTQLRFAYHSNRIEGSALPFEAVKRLFEEPSFCRGDIGADDAFEALGHFECFDEIVQRRAEPVSDGLIKSLHLTLMRNVRRAREPWFALGEYKREENVVGGQKTAAPKDVPRLMGALLAEHNAKKNPSFDDLLDFHARFEAIHPFADGNGRVGRLLLFKECLRRGVMPFVVLDELKAFYYRGLKMWGKERGWLRDTCLNAQDVYASWVQEANAADREAKVT